ncbi:MAG: cytochrome c oxidase accessory protein CcoG [Bacteroidota bacterium]
MSAAVKERQIGKDEFRDRLATVSATGKRNWIYPKKPKGTFYNARNVVALALLVFFFAGPFITIMGQPLLMINILEREFVLFGMAFWPQDLHVLVFGMLAFVLFVVLFTTVFGRIWCGWACPQTIFMELVFRRIEYWIEGDANEQIRLNKSSWNTEKVLKKGSKHAIFYGLSFVISNLFLAYIIGKDALFEIITDPPSEHLGGLSAMIIFSGVFYGVFAFMREQVCHFVCPYGRMQSVMVDNNTINVMYDYSRGETRAKIGDRRKVEAGKATLADLGFADNAEFGDCIDCYQCVQVCPMGIDIRNGTQLECVHCTACIDACDSIMDKIDQPRGLIRYASETGIREGNRKIMTPRTIGYFAVFMVLMSVFVTLMFLRKPVETTILRAPGTLYQTLPNNQYSNIYQIQIINKTFDPMNYELRLLSPQGELVPLGIEEVIDPQTVSDGRFLVKLPADQLQGMETEIQLAIFGNGTEIQTLTTGFLSPSEINK